MTSFPDAGEEDMGDMLFFHVQALFPVFRSITGEGIRQTLQYIGRHIPLTQHEVPSGTQVLDWVVPQEWTPRAASIKTLDGRVIVDFADCGLHLVHYSRNVDRVVPWEELQTHLHSLPMQPDLIPYRTAYFADDWGFCLSQRQREALTEPAYRVRIDADFGQGVLNYGECLLPGAEDGEVLISIHCCHPSLANDNLSGLAVGLELARHLAKCDRRLSWRFLFIPGTIGAITWLAQNPDAARHVRHGLVLTCLGDGAPFAYKSSRRGDAQIDRIMAHVLRQNVGEAKLLPFEPYGYDERQYCSPGFNLPVGCLMRGIHGQFPEYHTSADNLDFVRPQFLAESFLVLQQVAEVLEADVTYVSTSPYGEPQLGRRGLYGLTGGGGASIDQMAILWTLNLADGDHTLLDIAERSGRPFAAICRAANALLAKGLLLRRQQKVLSQDGMLHHGLEGSVRPRARQ
jgi:aminopeptidase-like protein